MPLYTYQHPETKEYIDIIQGMNDTHVYVDQEGVSWRRIFYSPPSTSFNPTSSRSAFAPSGSY
jgi:predicted nucleic acid-binding Zn ribbon protein